MSAYRSESPAVDNIRRIHPIINSPSDPNRHGHRPFMSSLVNQINYSPTSLPVLQVFHIQGREFKAQHAKSRRFRGFTQEQIRTPRIEMTPLTPSWQLLPCGILRTSYNSKFLRTTQLCPYISTFINKSVM
jgi:hypothetical protein